MRASLDVEEGRFKKSGGYNVLDKAERGSSGGQKSSNFHRSPSIEGSPVLRKNLSRSLFKAKSRVLNELNIQEVPEVKIL